MKKIYYTWLLVVLIIGFLPRICLSQTIKKVGEWGSGYYDSVVVQGNYAYCCTFFAGVDIIDISSPTNPQKVSNYMVADHTYDDDHVYNIAVIGNYAYVAAGSGGLQVVNISNPASPYLKGSWKTDETAEDVFINGQYAYIANGGGGLCILNIANPVNITLVGHEGTSGEAYSIYVSGNYAYVAERGLTDRMDQYSDLAIIDISSPANPFPVSVGWYPGLSDIRDIYIKDNYAYITDYNMCLQILDISNPADPKLAASFDNNSEGKGIFIEGDYAYMASGNTGLQVLDISNPTSPMLVGYYNTPGESNGITVKGHYAYVGDGRGGLQIIDISTPSNPIPVGSYDHSNWGARKICLKDNYIYLACGPDGLIILDATNPGRPTLAGCYDTPSWAQSVDVDNNLAYVANDSEGLFIIDVSKPSAPSLKGSCSTKHDAGDVKVSGNYAYVADDSMLVIDVSNPSSPTMAAEQEVTCRGNRIFVSRNYAYVSNICEGLKIINISNPTSPKLEGTYYHWSKAWSVFVSNHYAYIGSDSGRSLLILNVSVPNQPKLVKEYSMPDHIEDLAADDNYLYTATRGQGLRLVDIAMPSDPMEVAKFLPAENAKAVAVNGDYIYLADNMTGKLYVLQMDHSTASPRLKIDHTKLYFAAELPDSTTSPQSLLVSNSGAGTMTWSVSANENWLKFSPTSGTNSSVITVSANPTGLTIGTYSAVLSISSPQANNSPLKVEIQFQVYKKGQTSAPFGEFSTPTHGSTVSSSVPFTGWVLDDIGVQSVQLFLDAAQGLVYIGDAVFVEGARPDVEESYPNYPMNYKAGWGYMMLTNFLPGGDGIATIHAVATDLEGNQVTLGSKTITVANANAVKPFGAIDTPAQGGTASGNEYINFGWVLTPLPNAIPTDGSTIRVWVDGVFLGNPVYNMHREDVSALFPDNKNSKGAGGYFYLDTTPYANGIHTIQWSATDDAGNSDGIGSRYFTVLNTANTAASADTASTGKRWENFPPTLPIPHDMRWNHQVKVVKGFPEENLPQSYYPRENHTISLEIKELDRVEIHLSEESTGTWMGYQMVGEAIRPLPIGSTLDMGKGIFCWQPGAGFIGRYRFIFIEKDQNGNILSGSKIVMTIKPKF
jgi:hypothetical protein